MNEFFQNNSLCLFAYLMVVVLLMYSIVCRKSKKYVLMLALTIFIVDISALMVLGFELHKCAIACGICVILVLVSIKEGRDYEL